MYHTPLHYTRTLTLYANPYIIHEPLHYTRTLTLYTNPYIIREVGCFMSKNTLSFIITFAIRT